MPSFGFGHSQPKLSQEKQKPQQDTGELVKRLLTKEEHIS